LQILPNNSFDFIELALAKSRLKEILNVADPSISESSPIPGCPTPHRRQDRDKEGPNSEAE
jgi:hypothetical protein